MRPLILTIILTAALLNGCEPATRYRTLSFFFDGVPDPSREETVKGRKGFGGDTGGSIAKSSSQHGPYAAKMCDGCHIKGKRVFVAPREELCFRCHQFRMDNKWVHGPLASGGCLVCHNPHGSRNQFLLVSETEDFCFYCHDEKAVAKNEAHEGAGLKCTSCHDAHMSENQYMLR